MDVFTPSSQIYPYRRTGGVPSTIVQSTETGAELRRQKWAVGPLRVSLKFFGQKTDVTTDYDIIKANGGFTSVKMKDPYDTAIAAENIGTGNASRTIFYTNNKYLDSSTVVVYIDGILESASNYSVSNELGKITFSVTPGSGEVITIDYEYYRAFYFDLGDGLGKVELDNLINSVWYLTVDMIERLS